MAKNNKITAMIALTLFFISIIFVSMFNSGFAFGADNKYDYFNVTVTVTGIAVPNITGISLAVLTPNIGGIAYGYVLVNITDNTGFTDIDETQTYINISLNGVSLTGTVGCTNISNTAITRTLNCSIPVEYFREPGNWNISAYTVDKSANSDTEINGSTLTYWEATGFELMSNNISFTGDVGFTVGSSNDPLILNNTGNKQFNYVNITATGLSDGSNTIGVGNFTVNTTDAQGMSLSLNDKLIPGAVLPYGQGAAGTENLYFYLNVPPVPVGTYDSQGEWTIEVYN